MGIMHRGLEASTQRAHHSQLPAHALSTHTRAPLHAQAMQSTLGPPLPPPTHALRPSLPGTPNCTPRPTPTTAGLLTRSMVRVCSAAAAANVPAQPTCIMANA